VLLIQGPTAAGKSALALALAHALNGAIVNADSMQVYRDLRVLTARPSQAEEAGVAHHLFGHVDAGERYSVGRWLEDALAAIGAIRASGRMAILVGGTGLYFRALTEGLAEIPAPDGLIVAALEQEADRASPAALHARLDPVARAALQPNDRPRIIRALAVLETTGQPISSFHAATRPPLAVGAWAGVALTPPRAGLYQAINARFSAMLAEGALEEARALMQRRLDPMLPAMKAHGAPWLMAHLRGEISLEAAADLARRDTRRYAKRQFTWIANQAAAWPTISEPGLADRLRRVLSQIAR
jgi:tRNA dimethylallyltransferase